MQSPIEKIWFENAYHRREAVARGTPETVFNYVEENGYLLKDTDVLFLIEQSLEPYDTFIRCSAIRLLAILIEEQLYGDAGSQVFEEPIGQELQLSLFKQWINDHDLEVAYSATEFAWQTYLVEAIPILQKFRDSDTKLKKSVSYIIDILSRALVYKYRNRGF